MKKNYKFSIFIFFIISLILFSNIVVDVYAVTGDCLSEGKCHNNLTGIRSFLTGNNGSSSPAINTRIDDRYDALFTNCNAASSKCVSKDWEEVKKNTYQYFNSVQTSMAAANARGKNGERFLDNALANFNEHAQYVYSFLMAFGALTSLLMFIIIFVRITWLPEHAYQKRKAMEDMVISGTATILLGGSWLIISLFYSVFSRMWEVGTVYSKDWRSVGGILLVEYRGLIVGFLGVATLTALLMMIKSITGVIFAGTNPGQKSAKMMQVVWCGIATAGLGSLTIFTSLFWNVLRF